MSQLMSWGFFFSLSYFFGPMTEDLGWSSTEFSTVNLFSVITFAAVSPVIGRYVDQHNARPLMVVGGILAGFGIAATAYIQQVWQFYLLMGIFVPVAMSLYGLLVTSVALANWFHRRRGRAFAIASIGTSLGGVTFGPLASYLIGTVGWRETWFILGIIVAAGITLPSLLFMTRRPEDVGLYPDGERPQAPSSPRRDGALAPSLPVQEHAWSRSEAIRTPAFWLIVVSFAMSNLVISAFLLHLIPYLRSSGFDAGQATVVAVVFSASLAICKPVFGILLERFPSRYVSFASFATSAAAILILVVAPSSGFLILGTLLYGISMGGAIPMEDVTWAGYFGRWTVGRIRGIAYPIESLVGASGPVIGGLAFDATGGYTGAFVIFAAAYSLASLSILVARPPRAPLASRAPVPAAAVPSARRAPWAARFAPRAAGAVRAVDARGLRWPRNGLAARFSPMLIAGIAGVCLGMLVNLVTLGNRRGTGGRRREGGRQ